jgi:PPOX class probable F420-dependent enzyme
VLAEQALPRGAPGGERGQPVGVTDPAPPVHEIDVFLQVHAPILQAWPLMSRRMTRDEWRAFLSMGTRTGMLATVRRDGRPHVVPIWFVLDADDLVFTTGASSVKAHAMRRDPRVCLCVDDARPPYAYVMVEGTAQLSEDPAQMLRFATVIGGRYMGAERAEQFGLRNAVPGEVVVRVTPTHVTAVDDIAD